MEAISLLFFTDFGFGGGFYKALKCHLAMKIKPNQCEAFWFDSAPAGFKLEEEKIISAGAFSCHLKNFIFHLKSRTFHDRNKPGPFGILKQGGSHKG